MALGGDLAAVQNDMTDAPMLLVAGEPVRGSWWGHPKGHDIFAACQHLLQHPDATTAKLVSGKVTYVHRELWPSLLAVATGLSVFAMSSIVAKIVAGAIGGVILAAVAVAPSGRIDR